MQNNQLLSTIFEKFHALFGVNFQAFFDGDQNAISWDMKDFADCRNLSEHLFYLGLKNLYEQKIANIAYPLTSLLRKGSAVAEDLAKHQELIGLLNELTDIEEINSHQELIKNTVSALSNRDLTDEELTTIDESAWYSFAAFAKLTVRGLQSYNVGYFSHEAHLPTKFAQNVYVIEDERHILGMARTAKPGVYIIALANENEAAASCFYMILKTDEGSIILTDTQVKPYVGQRSRNDRRNVERIEKSLFPYSVLNLEVSNNDRHACFNRSDSKSLTLHNESFEQGVIRDIVPLYSIPLSSQVNLAVLLTMITSDWRSYTGKEQLTTGTELLLASPEASNNPQLPVTFGDTEPLSIPVIASKEAFYESSSACAEYKKKGSGVCNSDRNDYFSSVFEDELSQVQIVSDKLLLENKLESDTRDLITIPEYGIATPKMLVADTIQLAREKQASRLTEAVNSYFDANENNMLKWIYENINIEKMARLAIEKKQLPQPENAPEWMAKSTFGHNLARYGLDTNYYTKREIHQDMDDLSKGYRVFLGEPIVKKDKTYASCVITGASASYFVLFRIKDCFDVEYMTDTSRDDLPYHMRELGMDRYVGNGILDRIDPVEKASNKFFSPKSQFSYVLGFSLGGLNKVRAEMGLPKLTKEEAKALYYNDYPNFW